MNIASVFPERLQNIQRIAVKIRTSYILEVGYFFFKVVLNDYKNEVTMRRNRRCATISIAVRFQLKEA